MMPMFMGGPQMMMGPQMMGGMGCMGGFGNPMQMMMMQMMQLMMQMMGQMMGGQMNGQMNPQMAYQQGMMDGMNAARMGGMMGNNFGSPMGGMPFGGMPMGFPQGGYQNFCPCGGGYGGQQFPGMQANPGQQIPNFGPNPNKQEIGQLIDAAARKYGVPPEIAKAVAYKESGWNARASSFDGGHGKGVMQIDDRSHNFARGPQVWDAGQNVEYGVKLLADNFKRYGNWHDAVRHYNGSGPMAERYANSVLGMAQSHPWQKFGVQ